MKILIIGYGSIGKKHAEIIKKNFKFVELFILSRRKIKKKGLKFIHKKQDIRKINPSYVIISSETNKHFSDLKYLENNFKNINILVEKPLFEKKRKIQIKNNKVFIGYNLRLHPLIIFLKKYIKKNQPIDIKMITNTFLPNWRKRSYLTNYAMNKKMGGGVILDLSHEIDLASWLFGKIKINYLSYGKFSNLKVKTEDSLKLLGTIKKSNFFLDLSYFSKNEIRKIYLDTKNNSLIIDLKENTLRINSKIKKIISKKYKTDFTYLNLHKAIIFKKNLKNICTFNEGKEIINLIEKIKKR
jgi:predicted dehydrogenase|tara:strand:+ start:470 stop:1366 length:897 start_codon:yes stop_codon:yes gene_type:complete